MGLDVFNDFFGSFHLNWTGTNWFEDWCDEHGLSNPFIGWESGDNDGDQCKLGPGAKHTRLARDWCDALEQTCLDIAQLGKRLLDDPPENLYGYFYPYLSGKTKRPLKEKEWGRRVVSSWYAILRNGLAHGDTLEYR